MLSLLGPALLANLALVGGPTTKALDLEALYLKLAPSTVVVTASVERDGTTTESTGGGVVLEGGYVLTACHVLEFDGAPVARAEIRVGDQRSEGMIRAGATVDAKMVRCDTERDLALLKPAEAIPMRTLKLAKTNAGPGARVLAIGPTSNGFPWSVHECSVAGVGRLSQHSTELLGPVSTPSKELPSVLALDVTCIGGQPMSGSPVFDGDGRVLGIKQFNRYRTDNKAGTKREFFIAASEVRAFLDE